MIELVLVVVLGLLVLDLVLEVWRRVDGVERLRQRDRDRAAMLRALDRTGGRRP